MEPATASFLVRHTDASAGISRDFQLHFWDSDASVSMVEVAAKRVFLKRCVPPEKLTLKQLCIGAKIVVCARPLDVVDYADERTRKRFASVRGSTLLLVTPDAYHHTGKIIRMVYAAGLGVGRLLMVRWNAEEAAAFVALSTAGRAGAPVLLGATFTRDHMLAMEVTGDDVIARTHALVGPLDVHDAVSAAPASIRAVLGAAVGASPCVYTSISAEAAAPELSFVFDTRQRSTAVYTHCAVCVVKPHAVAKGALGDIVDKLLECEFEVSAVRSAVLTRPDAADFLEAYRGVMPEYDRWVTELASGPSVALEVRGEDVVPRLRALAGPYDTEIARALRPDSLRSTFGEDAVRNAVHVTDLPTDGPLESKFLFHVLA